MMTRNHLPGGADLDTFGRPLYAETPYRGVGFGLGFAVVLDLVAFRSAAPPGEYSWGGAAQHGLLGRPARGRHVRVHDVRLPVRRAPPAQHAPPAGGPGVDRLTSRRLAVPGSSTPARSTCGALPGSSTRTRGGVVACPPRRGLPALSTWCRTCL